MGFGIGRGGTHLIFYFTPNVEKAPTGFLKAF